MKFEVGQKYECECRLSLDNWGSSVARILERTPKTVTLEYIAGSVVGTYRVYVDGFGNERITNNDFRMASMALVN